MKKIILFILIFISAISFNLVKAQSSSVQISSSLPRLYISNITLDKDSYKIGETIHGSFDVQNSDQNNTPDVNYLVSLVGLSADGHTSRVVYDTQKNGPVSILGNSSKTINFSYNLKSAPSNDSLAIHIRVIMKEGTSLAWQLTPLKVVNGSVMLQVSSAYVTLNGRKYSLQEGPTVKPLEKISFTGEYLNNSSKDISLKTQTILLDKSSQPIIDVPIIKGKSIIFSHGTTTVVTIDLPVSNLKQGIYLAKTSLVDENNNQMAPDLFSRYILSGSVESKVVGGKVVDIITSGNIVNIQSVYSDTNFPLKKDQKASLLVQYTGNPSDISKIDSSSSVPTSTPVIADVNIKLTNQDNQIVSDVKLKDQTFLTTGFIKVPFNVDDDSNSLIASINVFQGSTTIISYEGNVVYDGKNVLAEPKIQEKQNNNYLLIIASIISFLIMIFIIFYVIKKKRMSKAMNLLVIMLFLSFSFLSYKVLSVKAFIVTSDTSGGWIQITGGPPPSATPGSTFPVNITVSTVACTNSNGSDDVSASFNGKNFSVIGIKSNSPTWNGVDYSTYTVYNDFYLGDYTAPNTSGIYNFNVSVHNSWYMSGYWGQDPPYWYQDDGELDNGKYYDGAWRQDPPYWHDAWSSDIGTISGYWPVIVGTAPSAPTINSTGGPLSCGVNSYTFNWSTISGATFYGAHILDDTVRPSGAADCTYGTDVCVGDASVGTSYTMPVTSQTPSCGILAVGSYLTPGQFITSCDGRFKFILQGDGNAVIYNSSNVALWSSNTATKPSAKIIMQTDGNLVIYNSSDGFIWGSVNSAGGHTGTPTGLNMQGDGNLVIYATNGSVLWNSGTGGHGVATLQPGHSYEARAYAYNSVGWSGGSNTIYFTVPTTLACTSLSGLTPSGLTVTNPSSTCGGSIQISWTALTGANGYDIYRSSDGGTTYSKIATTSSVSYSDNPLPPGNYYYKIDAYNASGTSNQTSVKNVDNSLSCSCIGPDGTSIPNGSSKNYYSATTATLCSAISESRTCSGKVLSGSYLNPSCTNISLPVVINNFSISPSTVSPYNAITNPTGGKCNFSWKLSQADASSTCAIYNGASKVYQFTTADLTSLNQSGLYVGPPIKIETTYKLICGEMVTNSPDVFTATNTQYTTCNINPSFNETNN